jgi:hypothetical protein
VINAMAASRAGGTGRMAVQHRLRRQPVTDRDNGHQHGPGRGTSGGVGAAPGAKRSLWEVDVETWDAIRSRRNVRSYSQQAIAPQDLERILEAARRTPSAGNQQAWDFVVCTDRE